LFEELTRKVEGFLECEPAFALEDMDRVVRDGFRLGLGMLILISKLQ